MVGLHNNKNHIVKGKFQKLFANPGVPGVLHQQRKHFGIVYVIFRVTVPLHNIDEILFDVLVLGLALLEVHFDQKHTKFLKIVLFVLERHDRGYIFLVQHNLFIREEDFGFVDLKVELIFQLNVKFIN